MKENDAQKEIVNRFLGNFKKQLSKRALLFLKRDKNMRSLTEMGFTILDVQTELIRLEYIDYISGPKPDIDPKWKGDIWEFGKTINNENIYIKIKLASDSRPVCLSFHHAEKDLKYFFK